MKIINIVGARPQFIKYFPISRAIIRMNAENPTSINDILIHTGQHYDYLMSKVFFDEFGIPAPHYHLEVGSGPHGRQTGEIMAKVEEVLEKEKPQLTVVYGDTNSTLGGALAAAKLHLPVAHVEAGLRSYNKYMPEEINRILTDQLSTLLFCPSLAAIQNLQKEGFANIFNAGSLVPVEPSQEMFTDLGIINKNQPLIINNGDIMYDVLLFAVQAAARRATVLSRLQLPAGAYAILTLHRAENTDNIRRFDEIIDFVNGVAQKYPVVFPVHPRTQKMYGQAKNRFSSRVEMIEPLGYFDMVTLLQQAALVMTDSGGLQKEAYWLKVPCITLRDETEWVETVASGWNVLYKDYQGRHYPKTAAEPAYGDGRAAMRIVQIISHLARNLT